ncbi:hypothetical protein ACFCXK_32605 [Streptomyces sp. NPDC056269]|nr:hypothetical protein [Streptomyces sp. MBT42]
MTAQVTFRQADAGDADGSDGERLFRRAERLGTTLVGAAPGVRA